MIHAHTDTLPSWFCDNNYVYTDSSTKYVLPDTSLNSDNVDMASFIKPVNINMVSLESCVYTGI